MTNAAIIALTREFIRMTVSQRANRRTLAAGEKTPRQNFRLGDLRVLFPHARFINIVRQPYDVAISLLHHARRAGVPQALDQGSVARLERGTNAATAWKVGQESVARFKTRNPEPPPEVQYEDMLEGLRRGSRRFFAISVSATRQR